MNAKYDDWEANSFRHIAALESALNGNHGNDLMVPYQEVAYELLAKVVFQHLNQAAAWSIAVTSIPSLNLIPVNTLAR